MGSTSVTAATLVVARLDFRLACPGRHGRESGPSATSANSIALFLPPSRRKLGFPSTVAFCCSISTGHSITVRRRLDTGTRRQLRVRGSLRAVFVADRRGCSARRSCDLPVGVIERSSGRHLPHLGTPGTRGSLRARTRPLEPLYDALYEHESVDQEPRHQVGGHATPVQGPVEMKLHGAAHRSTGREPSWTDAAIREAGANWNLIAQIDSDQSAGTMWGDVGTLYYLMRPDDLRARRFEQSGSPGSAADPLRMALNAETPAGAGVLGERCVRSSRRPLTLGGLRRMSSRPSTG